MSLSSFLTGIADAIRAKEGSTETIPASDFAERIAALSGGGVGTKLASTSVVGVVSDSGTKVTFTLPDDIKGHLERVVYAYITCANSESNTITQITTSMVWYLMFAAITGLRKTAGGEETAVFDPVTIRNASGQMVYDAWCFASTSGSNPMLVTGDGDTVSITINGALSTYASGGQHTVTWPTSSKVYLWLNWAE